MRALPRDLTRRSRPCTRVREALSAQHDDEALPPSLTPMRITEHLAGCSACARFAGELDVLSGRIVSSDPGSSSALSSRILTTLAEADATRRHVLSLAQLRWLVGLAGAVQLTLALPVLFGAVGPGLHAGRELGSLQLAIGVGLVVAAVQPMRAAGVLTVVGVVTGLTVVVAGIDLAAGAASLGGELVHVSELVGLAALWALARRTPLVPASTRRLSAS